MAKRPLAGPPQVRTQRIGEKMGTKRSVLTDERGLPLSVVPDGANRHDIKLLERTLDNLVIPRPEPTAQKPQNLCLDGAYVGSEDITAPRRYIAHIRLRSDEKIDKQLHPDYRARRWVVEVAHSFFNRFRKILIRFEKKDENYLFLIQFACAVIVWRKLFSVHLS